MFCFVTQDSYRVRGFELLLRVLLVLNGPNKFLPPNADLQITEFRVKECYVDCNVEIGHVLNCLFIQVFDLRENNQYAGRCRFPVPSKKPVLCCVLEYV